MPYADIEDRREYKREYMRTRYHEPGRPGREFRDYESQRKAEWLEQNKEKQRVRQRIWRAKKRAKELIDAGRLDEAKAILDKLEGNSAHPRLTPPP